MSLACLRQTGAGVEICLYVQPRASRNKIVGLQGQELKLALTAPPVDGAANRACRDFVAKFCNLPKRRVVLTSGETSRHKRVLLEDADLADVTALMNQLLGS